MREDEAAGVIFQDPADNNVDSGDDSDVDELPQSDGDDGIMADFLNDTDSDSDNECDESDSD